MSFKFGAWSEETLSTVVEPLQQVVRKVLELGVMDFTVVCGVRTKAEQDRLFAAGKSKLSWPKSKHNAPAGMKSKAVDIAPYVNNKISWNFNDCCFLAGMMIAVGKTLGVNIRWGGNWDCDGEIITDQTFQDLVHFEVKE